MDARLQHLYRQYLEGQTFAAYMQYYLETRRAGVVAECFSGRQCPHCALNEIKNRFPATHEIHDSLLEFFSSFQLTDNNTYLRTVEVGPPGPDYWIPALFYILAGLGGTEAEAEQTIASQRGRELLGSGEMCYGTEDPP